MLRYTSAGYIEPDSLSSGAPRPVLDTLEDKVVLRAAADRLGLFINPLLEAGEAGRVHHALFCGQPVPVPLWRRVEAMVADVARGSRRRRNARRNALSGYQQRAGEPSRPHYSPSGHFATLASAGALRDELYSQSWALARGAGDAESVTGLLDVAHHILSPAFRMQYHYSPLEQGKWTSTYREVLMRHPAVQPFTVEVLAVSLGSLKPSHAIHVIQRGIVRINRSAKHYDDGERDRWHGYLEALTVLNVALRRRSIVPGT